MPDSDFTITLAANVSDFTSGMEAAASSAKASAEEIDAAFAAAGAQIHDYAEEMQNSAFQEASDAERTTAINQEAYEQILASEAGIRAEMDGTADVRRAAAAQAEEASQREAAAMKEVEVQAEASTMTFGKMKGAFWDLFTVVFAFDAVKGIFNDLVQSQIELSSEIQRTAEIMGTTNLEAHAWIDAAELSGVAANSFTTASRTMNSQVAAGGKQLKEMGISMTDTNGKMKTTGELIEETVAKLETYSASADRNALAQKTLGRGWIDLVANGQSLIANLKQQEQEMAGTGAAQDALVAQGKQLQAINAQVDQSWRAISVSAGPALIGILKGVEEALLAITANAQSAMVAIEGVFKVASQLGGVAKGISEVTPGGGDLTTDQAALVQGYKDIADSAKGVGDAFTDTAKKLDDIQKKLAEQRGQLWEDHTKEFIDRAQQVAGTQAAPPAAIPKAGKGGGGGGGADPMAGVDDALISSQNQMDKLAQEYQKLGSEAQMSSKASQASFAELRAKAVEDYQVMMDAHKAFATAVQSGDAEAAKASEKDWHDAAQKFQQDWEQAKTKATADMQQIKSAADTMASEVSGILNGAISGKLNWAQEFDKILSQMLDKLIKHLAQQVAMWAANEMQVNAIKQAGAVTGLAEQKAANTAAGASDAVTAAKGAYSSASQVQYIGWLIAPVAAAAAFAGVEAFGSTEQGFDVPPGAHPMVNLHPREMVLPADLAQNVRNMTSSGGGGGGGGVHNTMNIQSLDPSSLADIVSRNPDLFGKAVAQHRRNGGRFATG